MNTYATKPSDITRKWYVVDATDVVLGRLAAQVANKAYACHAANISLILRRIWIVAITLLLLTPIK